jgi:hypothetical protein
MTVFVSSMPPHGLATILPLFNPLNTSKGQCTTLQVGPSRNVKEKMRYHGRNFKVHIILI